MDISALQPSGRWHGHRFYFGLHYDLHPNPNDTALGTRCSPRELVPSLRLLAPDFVQTDCKGHPGFTSWFSRVPTASVAPGLKQDALRQWRAATKRLGLPLHCHYSGIWDKAAGAKYPHWCAVTADGKRAGAAFGPIRRSRRGERMCPRSPYLERLMIPQLLELVDRYEVDGFWVDGDIWAVEPCYCRRCRAAYGRRPPTTESAPDWPQWWQFTLRSFQQYVTRYCDAVHRHKPGVLVCSNWLQTFANPGPPTVPTDWISGDNAWVWGLDNSRCEARFLATRGKPWDIMLWSFYCSHQMGAADSPWVIKPAQMLMQEAAVLLAFGGHVQLYETTSIRDGRLVAWRLKRLRQVREFVRRRRALCQNSTTIPQIAVLHSEHHLAATVRRKNLLWGVDTAPVRGAVFALLENHFGVDILDEWALRPRLAEYPVVVVPEQHALSAEMVAALKQYVRRGGKLLLTGAESLPRFGAAFLGVTRGSTKPRQTCHVPVGDGLVPLYSERWRFVKPTTARSLGALRRTPLWDDQILPHPAATLQRVGRGAVAYIPAAVCRDFQHNRYPQTRQFLGAVVRRLAGPLDIEVHAPVCVDVALRRQPGRRLVHLINRASGVPNQPSNGAVDEIPPVGPVVIRWNLPARPRAVTAAWEKARLRWRYARGRLTVIVPRVHIHLAVRVDESAARPVRRDADAAGQSRAGS